MQLSQCATVLSEVGAEVRRDGAFGSLGFLAHRRDAMLTFLADASEAKLIEHEILDVDEIVEGIDDLGVLLYGHEKNALWYGSRLSNAETRSISAENPTGAKGGGARAPVPTRSARRWCRQPSCRA